MNKGFLATLIVTGLIAGLLLTWHFDSPLPAGNFPTDEVEARDDLLKSFLHEQSYLQSRIVSLRGEIEESQNSITTYTKSVNLEFLESLKRDVGLTEVMGPGIEIILDDSPFALREGIEVSDANLVQASDIRDLVNILNAADADAISINSQRIIATSPISSVGASILVNNSHLAPPFIISAVGDTEIMLQRLLNQSLLTDLYERRETANIAFDIYKKNRIVIPIYNGDLKINYLTLVEE